MDGTTQKYPSVGLTKSAIAEQESVFELADKLVKVLEGKSYRTCLQALRLVAAHKGLRVFPDTQPIGRSVTGTVRVAPVQQVKKGKPPEPAKWKQTETYRSLMLRHQNAVSAVKMCPPGEDNSPLIQELRVVEQQLKDLKSLKAGGSMSQP